MYLVYGRHNQREREREYEHALNYNTEHRAHMQHGVKLKACVHILYVHVSNLQPIMQQIMQYTYMWTPLRHVKTAF